MVIVLKSVTKLYYFFDVFRYITYSSLRGAIIFYSTVRICNPTSGTAVNKKPLLIYTKVFDDVVDILAVIIARELENKEEADDGT